MTREEIMGLTGRELDFAVGREVMGYSVYHYDKSNNDYYLLWDREGNPVFSLWVTGGVIDRGQRDTESEAWADTPKYTIDANALRDMEAAIQSSEIKFLQNYYLLNLLEILDTESEPGYWRNTSQGVSLECLVLVRFASPTDCCRAALLAVTEAQK